MNNVAAIIPFFCQKNDFNESLLKLETTIQKLTNNVKVDIVCVIDDTCWLLRESEIHSDFLIESETTKGKEWAIIEWITTVLSKHPEIKYIVQSDYDLEQDPDDAKKLLEYIEKKQLSKNFLIIWDRYKNMKTINQYRETVLDIQSVLSNIFGYNIQDITSWLRVYSSDFWKLFSILAKWKNFSSDLDQFIIWYLNNTTIEAVDLHNATPRSMYTKWDKLMQVFSWILTYKTELIQNWKQNIVELFENIISGLEKKENIIIDMNMVGVNKKYIYKNMGDDKYSLRFFE